MKNTVLIYDAECSLCCGYMNWIKSYAMKSVTFEFIPCQSDEWKIRFPGIEEEACMKSLHLVKPDGRILAGDKSLPEILCNLRYFRWLAIFFRIPIFSFLSYFVHRRIANNRYIISRTLSPLTEKERKKKGVKSPLDCMFLILCNPIHGATFYHVMNLGTNRNQEEYLTHIVEYVHQNPLRAKMINDLNNYK